MKKRMALCLCLLLLFSLCITVRADILPRVVDHADLISDSEEAALEEQIRDVRDNYGLDVVILTVLDTDGASVQTYADDYYDQYGYGYGEDSTGVLLLISMKTREWYISTCGEAIYALTDYGLEVLGEETVYFLSNAEYYMAFENFVNSLPKYMTAYREGSPIDGYAAPDAYYSPNGESVVYYPDSSSDFTQTFLICLVIGAVVALVTVLIMVSRMNTAKLQKNAGSYLKDNSYHLHTRQDIFLYSRVSKTPKAQNNSGGRGGSSVHRSSGGRSHGGRGGRF